MADSRREILTKAVTALLGAGGKPAGLNVSRGRYRAAEEGDLPLTTVFVIDEPQQEGDDDAIENLLQLGIMSRVKAGSSESADETLDPILVWIVQAILADNTLGGLCLRVRLIRTDWDQEELLDPYGGAIQTFEIQFTTTESDPTAGLE